MKKPLIATLVFILFLTPISSVSAQVSSREALVAQLQTLLVQLASLQAQLSALQEDRVDEKRVLGVSARNIEPSKYYSGTYEAVYLVDEVSLTPYKNTITAQSDLMLFNLLIDVMGERDVRDYIAEFRIYNDPNSELDAFVEQFGQDDYWVFGVNSANVSSDRAVDRELANELFIHEYAHILSHYNLVIQDEFDDEFWKYKSRREKDFVSYYAMIDNEEDFAESFMFFVLNSRPRYNSMADKKVLFFYEFDLFRDIREDIRDRLFD